MECFTAYDTSTGEITGLVGGIGATPPLDTTLTKYIAGEFDSGLGYVNFSGEFVPYSTEQHNTKSARPQYPARWSNVTMQWEDPRTLDDLKAAKWEQVKAQRDAAEFGLFVWSGHAFDGDESAQRRINLAVMGVQAAVIAGNSSWSVDWTLADNTSLTLSASDMIGVANALGANIAQAHALARVKRQQIEAAQTLEELDAL